MTTPMNKFDHANDVDIVSYLADSGYKWVRKGNRFAYYFSPIRNESNVSFRVNLISNKWTDFGLSQKGDLKPFGDIVDLVRWMENCDVNTALNIILDNKLPRKKFTPSNSPVQPGIKILNVEEIHSNDLINYLNKRFIPLSLASIYCKEITFCFTDGRAKDKLQKAVGFENVKGGWELRNDWFKGSNSPKTFSSLGPDTEKQLLFEGFTDFLSFLVINNVTHINKKVFILNSLVNVLYLVPQLQNKTNYIYFDNDKAADETLQLMTDEALSLSDKRNSYNEYNDLNEMLVTERLKERFVLLKLTGII